MSDATLIEVDARGHRCPAPTLRLRRALAAAPAGATAVLLADDPLASVDVAHFARMQGYELLSVEALVDVGAAAGLRFLVRKPAGGA